MKNRVKEKTHHRTISNKNFSINKNGDINLLCDSNESLKTDQKKDKKRINNNMSNGQNLPKNFVKNLVKKISKLNNKERKVLDQLINKVCEGKLQIESVFEKNKEKLKKEETGQIQDFNIYAQEQDQKSDEYKLADRRINELRKIRLSSQYNHQGSTEIEHQQNSRYSSRKLRKQSVFGTRQTTKSTENTKYREKSGTKRGHKM